MDIQVPILENRGYKTHMLGNIKLVGGLLARGMLAAKARFFFSKNPHQHTQRMVYLCT